LPAGTPSPIAELVRSAGSGQREAAEQLLPLLYDELRRLAGAYLRRVPPGNSLQATALVHEAYLRLIGDADPGWEGRRHFFGAAAQAMRNILVEQARRKAALKRGGDQKRVELSDADLRIDPPSDNILALNDALTRLETSDPRKAQIVLLHHFAGLTMEETAAALEISLSTAEREWRFVRALLFEELTERTENP
jgi:RNA polymerase sigma factor (TIGR02999 family)